MSNIRNVKDLMNPDIMTVADDMTTDALARYLIEREISGAPVVDSQGHLIGVVSMTDIGRNMAEPSDVESSRSSDFYRDVATDLTLEDLGQRYVEERAVTVRDVMTPLIHQVPVTASVAEAARLMVDQHIHRLVVTQGKEPVGIITSLDLLKVLAKQPWKTDGEGLFRSYCAACHGADGKGNGPAAFALKTPPADLTVIARRSGGTFPRSRIGRYVENGDPSIPAHGSKEMPVWGPNFVALAPGSNKPINERVDAVVAYIESIQIAK